MKKLISIILALSMVLSLVIVNIEATATGNTSLLENGVEEVAFSIFKNGTNQGGKDVLMDASSYTNQNTVVEVDYDFTMANENNQEKQLNIPFELRSDQSTKIARYAINDTTVYINNSTHMAEEYFKGKLLESDSSELTSGRSVVGKKGTIQMLIDYTEQKVYVQYKNGTGLKEAAFLGEIPFVNAANQLYLVNLGASGSPTTDFKVRAFVPENFESYKAFRTFYGFEMEGFEESLVSEDAYVSKWIDFNPSSVEPRTSTVYIPEEESGNHYVKIPQGNKYGAFLQRQNGGFTGKFDVSFKVKIPNLSGDVKVTLGRWDNVGSFAGDVRFLKSGYVQLVGAGTAQSIAIPSGANADWMDVTVKFDFNAGNMVLVYNGTESDPVSIKDTYYPAYNYLEHIEIDAPPTEVWFDDLEVAYPVETTETEPEPDEPDEPETNPDTVLMLCDRNDGYKYKEQIETTISGGGLDIDVQSTSRTRENTVVEVDYDFTGVSTNNNTALNFPITLRGKSGDAAEVEAAKFAIQDTVSFTEDNKVAQEFIKARLIYTDRNTNETYGSGNDMKDSRGVVEKKGKIQLLIDYTENTVYVQYFGSKFKTAQYFGKMELKDDNWGEGLNKIVVGAGGSATTQIKVRAFVPSDFESYKVFNTHFDYELDGYEDTLVSASAPTNTWIEFFADTTKKANSYIAKDASTSNHYIKVPETNGTYGLMFMRQNFGLEGKFDVSFKIKVADDTSRTDVTFGKWDDVGNWVAQLRIQNNSVTLMGTGGPTVTLTDEEMLDWIDVKIGFDFTTGKLKLTCNGQECAESEMKTEYINTKGLDYLEHMRIAAPPTEVWFDDLDITTTPVKVTEPEPEVPVEGELLNETFTLSSGGTVDKTVVQTKQNTVVEVDYDFTNGVVPSTALNLPIILMNETGEVARYSIIDTITKTADNKVAEEFVTGKLGYKDKNGTTYPVNNVKKDYSGVVAKAGKIQMIIDYTENVVHVQYTGTAFKQAAYLGSMPLADGAMGNGLAKVKIGASGAAETDITLKVFIPENFDEYKNFRTYYDYEIDGFEDDTKTIGSNSKASVWQDFVVNYNQEAGHYETQGFYIPEDAQGNHYVSIPANQGYGVLLQRQERGFTGKFDVSFKIKVNSDTGNSTDVLLGKFDDTDTARAGKVKILMSGYVQLEGAAGDTKSILIPGGDETAQWLDITVHFDFDNGTMALEYDGQQTETVAINSAYYTNNKYLEHIGIAPDKEVFLDDLEVKAVTTSSEPDTPPVVGTNPTITDLYDDGNRFSFATFNPGTKNKDNQGKIIIAIASYDIDGRLLEINAQMDYTWQSEEETLTIPHNDDATTIKAFMWTADTLSVITSIDPVEIE